MELSDDLIELNRQIDVLIFEEMLLSVIAYWLLGIMCLVFFIVSIVKFARKKWNSYYLIFINLLVLLWSISSLFALYSYQQFTIDFYNALRLILFVPIPALLVMHIHKQVSYKPVRLIAAMFYIAAPFVVVSVLTLRFYNAFIYSSVSQSIAEGWISHFFFLYAVISVISSYLLCFNVFYQMPPRARRSTRSILASVITLTILLIFYIIWPYGLVENLISDIIPLDVIVSAAVPFALITFIYPLYDSISIMPASDVIVTSREFVMKGLSTTVLVLNKRQLILDWNRRDWTENNLLPKPMYKENYCNYLKRVLSATSGRVSRHSNDIFIIKTDDNNESHLMQRVHEVGNKKHMMGYIVEIADVTHLYTKLRYFEEIALIDTLTGLYNRNAYIEYSEKAIQSNNLPLLVIVGDINKLKQTNDLYGHIEGDNLIKNIAKALAGIKPDNSFLARVGGDEFVLLVPDGSEEFAEEFISRAIEECGSVPNSEEFIPSVSWGYAVMASADQTYNDVFSEADKMMYEFKKSRVEFSSSGTLPPKNETQECEVPKERNYKRTEAKH
ncbi:MAG: diguanylate cyclase [Oscillospiraceae bacterium]|nr:diguanylate cyclase [Oscillospiraceae bacterium]